MHEAVSKVQQRIINEREKQRKTEEVMPQGYTFEELFETMVKEDVYQTKEFKRGDGNTSAANGNEQDVSPKNIKDENLEGK